MFLGRRQCCGKPEWGAEPERGEEGIYPRVVVTAWRGVSEPEWDETCIHVAGRSGELQISNM